MDRIFRYKIEATDVQEIEIPRGSQFLSFGPGVGGELSVWFLVNDQAPTRKETFCLYGTGHQVKCNPNTGWPGHFLGTAVQDPFVWHLFCISPMHHKNGRLSTGDSF